MNKDELIQAIEYLRMKQNDFRKRGMWSACIQYGVKADQLQRKLDYMIKYNYDEV